MGKECRYLVDLGGRGIIKKKDKSEEEGSANGWNLCRAASRGCMEKGFMALARGVTLATACL